MFDEIFTFDPATIAVALIAPTMFWIGYLYYKDRVRPEPFLPIVVTYVLGIIAGAFGYEAYVVAEWLGMPEAYLLSETSRPWFFVYVVGFVGVVEELVKAAVVVFFVRRFKAFDEVIDGIIYASVVALGYATFENLLYLPHLEGSALWGRAFASPLVHTMFSSIWGYAVARAHMQGTSVARGMFISLAISATVHGVYDFIATDPTLAPAAALAIGAVWFWRMRLIARLHADQRAQLERENAPRDDDTTTA